MSCSFCIWCSSYCQIYYCSHRHIVGNAVSNKSCTSHLLNMLKNSAPLVLTKKYEFCAGLPPSPPSAPEGVGDGAFGNNRNARAMKPLGVDIRRPKRKVNGSLIAIAVLSTIIALIICCLAAWLLILRFRGPSDTAQGFAHSVLPKFSRSSGMC